MKVYEAVAAALAAQGVEVVFGVLGEANMHLLATLAERHGATDVAAAREDGAVLMASTPPRSGAAPRSRPGSSATPAPWPGTMTAWLDEAGAAPAGVRGEALRDELAAASPGEEFTERND